MKKNLRTRITPFIVIAVAVGLLMIDQVIKYFVLAYLQPVGTVTVIPGLLELAYVENTGAAFGLFRNMMWFLVTVTLVACAVIIVLLFWYKHHSFFSYTTSALLIAGGLGNLVDRLLHGFVVDYIHVMFFGYIFNFADCCITVGAVCFIIHALFFTHEKDAQPQPEAGEK
ncbi:MAG: signal peptidase II [Acutalibacter sp.]